MLHALEQRGRGSAPVCLVLAPTRELAMQVSEATHRYGKDLFGTGQRRAGPAVYGGQPIGRQLRELDRGVDIVVGTPGRVIDHINRGTLKMDQLRTVVLDEADEMLDMGFAEDIEAILEAAPADRQTVLFSATIPSRIDKLARKYLRSPIRIEIRESAPAGEAPKVRQSAYVVARAHKPTVLGRVLDVEAPEAAIVFCRTREEVDSLTETLNGRGYRAEALHGGLSQEQRDKVMGRLRGRTADLLVATDVAARGLDVDHLTHVVNYNVPSAPEAYVHRIGRVGRAGREGVAITLAEPREHRMLKTIERATGSRISMEKVPTVADLQARRLELTRAALHEALIEDHLEGFSVVLDALTDEYDVVQVALAAIKLAHEASTGPAGEDEEDIPVAAPRTDSASYAGASGPGSSGPGSSGPGASGPGGKRPPRASRPDAARLFVGLGRAAGVRPQDLVGAITGETSLSGRDIGAIEISDRFALVEVPVAAADEVVAALRATQIKGRKASVRRDRGPVPR
jgi:ATP-dependent RNA helicase DeaD